MSKAVWLVSITVVAAGMWLPAARATDYPSEVVSFEGGSVDTPSAKEIFREPQWSPSTMGIHLNTTGSEDWNSAYKSTDFNGGYDGVQNLKIFFSWDATQVPLTDPTYQWVRLTSYAGALRPNPSLDARGRVEFRLLNRSGMFTGAFGLVLGIRETGVSAPQMGDGGVSGGIEWVGVTTANTIIECGTNGCAPGTVLAGDDQQFTTNGFGTWINWGPDRVLQSTAAGDDTVIAGYIRSPKGSPVPIPAVTITNSSDWLPVVFNLATGDVTFDGATVDGKVVSFAAGNGVLDPPNFRGTLEHLGIVRVASDTCDLSQACNIDFGIDALQFVATVPDPTVPPKIVTPLINGDVSVTVTDLMWSVNRVTLYRRANPEAAWVQVGLPIDVSDSADVEFDISSAPAVTGEEFAATQRNGQDGSTSGYSLPAVVYSGPPPLTFSSIIDGGGTGSCTGSAWEWINVTGLSTAVIDAVTRWYPQGATALFPDDAMWQTVDLSLTNTALMMSAYGGNGQLEPSPTGFWNMDTIWFTVGPGVSSNGGGWGPHEVFIDRIEMINSNGQVGDPLLTMEDGVNRFASIRGQSPLYSVSTAISSLASYDGSNSHRLSWTYTGIQTAAGILQRTTGCGTAAQIKDTSQALRFHVLFRGQRQAPTIPLPTVASPSIKGTQTTMGVRVNNDTTATAVQLYVNGATVGAPVNPTGAAFVDFTGLTLNVGDSISAKQTVPSGESDFAYPRGVSTKPNPPTLASQILPGATSVTVNNCLTTQFATATTVYVYVNGNYTTPRGSAAGGTASVSVTLSPAVAAFDVVTAKQLVNGALSDPSAGVTVSVPAPVIYAVPAEGDTSMKVQSLNAVATSASIKVKDSGGAVVGTYSQSFAAGATSVTVPVSGLVAGYTVTAYQTVNGVDSAESALETVSVNTVTVAFSDSMETYVDQADFANTSGEVRNTGWWPASGDPPLYLEIGGKNATPGGTKSAYYPAGMSSPYVNYTDGWQCNFDFKYPEPDWPVLQATATVPVVWSVNVYDAGGLGTDNLYQWVELRDYSTGSLGGIIAIGMPGTGFFPTGNVNYYQARVYGGTTAPGYINLNFSGAPQRSVGWHTFTAVIKATLVDFYVDGILSAKNVSRGSNPPYDNLYMGSGYASPMQGWYDDFRVHKGKFQIPDRIPNGPRVVAPVAMGDTVVTVTDVVAAANSVTVYANGSPIGSVTLSPPNAQTTVTVPVSPALSVQQSIKAKQTVTALGTSDFGLPLEVGRGNAPLMLGVGIRETGSVGALGSTDPLTTGAIEWINVTTNGADRIGYKIHPQPTWQTITLSSANGVTKFPGSGNGVINGTRGSLEHLALFMNTSTNGISSGPYRLYIDNVYNLNADGGADFLLTGFEGYALNSEVIFQEPPYSGSTMSYLDYWFGASATTNKYANGGTQSQLLSWFWKDTTAGKWIRDTSSGVANLARPIIDITKPIRMDVLLLPYCIKGDMDSNCSINLTDYTAFQACLGGPLTPSVAPTCACADFDEDGQVDLYDFAEFQRTFTGAGTISGCTP